MMRIWRLLIFLFKVNLSRTQLKSEEQCASWTAWSSRSTFICTAVCGEGLSKRQRTRDCLQSDLTPDLNCNFAQVEEQSKSCSVPTLCPAWDSWSSWSEQGSCSALCGSGVQRYQRRRECVGGSPCTGRSIEFTRRLCSRDSSICRVNGCNRRVYRVVPQLTTDPGKYALCRYGNIVTWSCPEAQNLRRSIRRLRWLLFFRSRFYFWNRIQLFQDIQQECGYT